MQATSERTEAASGALAGLRVIDLSRVLAGPLCTQMLSDHGADVVKIEPPIGDETRTLGPPFDDQGDAAYFTAVNRGKRAMALNLAHPAAQEVLLRLLENADVLVENFVPGTMERWGLGYEEFLKARFPKLIYCSITGFGPDGPLGGLPGYDAVLQAMCGLMSINGEPDLGPTRMGIPIVDHLTGYTALTGILLALHHRARTGKGQRVEATLFDTALSLLVPHAANWMYSGQVPGLLGSAHPNISPYDRFQCQDGQMFLGILNDRQFSKFCGVVGLQCVSEDPRFMSNAKRLQHRNALRIEIERALSSRQRDEVCAELMRSGVPAGPVHSVAEAFSQPHTMHRGMNVEMPGYKGVGVPVRLSDASVRLEAGAPRFGQHAQEILEEAGFNTTEVKHLRELGACPDSRP